MRILAVVQGKYGERIVENIRALGPKDWTIESFTAPRALPVIIDEPEEFLPKTLPQADLVLAMTENPRSAQLIPAIARLSGAKAVIAPIDNSAWMLTGLRNQIKREMEQAGVTAVFPKTFCTLTEKTWGYRHAAQPYENEFIAEFARHFGKPRFKITVNPRTRNIETCEVERGAPCGATHYAAKRLIGVSVEEAAPKAGLFSHQYPCLASMEREPIDDRLEDTLMHVSGFVVNEDMAEKVRPYKEKPQYFAPGERVEAEDGRQERSAG
ncbi:MAG: DUF166 family protein [Dehalococcoidia bacterium]|nr:DUF166 family protein [Dehalococcoidia bacterium]